MLGEIAPKKFTDTGRRSAEHLAPLEIDGQPLAPEAIVHEIGLFIAGGAETTRTAISHGLDEFTRQPAQWEAMHDDPSLVKGAVEEVLRWVTPLNNMFRRAVADDRIGDQPVERRRPDRPAVPVGQPR